MVICTNPPTNSTTNHCATPYTYHLIPIRYVAANKFIRKFWKESKARDVSLCYVIITLFYITLTLQIMSINVTYLDISVSNIPIALMHALYCVCPQPVRVSLTIQHKLWLSERTHRMILARLFDAMQYNIRFVWFSLRPDLKTHAHYTLVSKFG